MKQKLKKWTRLALSLAMAAALAFGLVPTVAMATAGEGTITATFTSLSPVAWFKIANSTDTGVSPKTNDAGNMAAWLAVAAFAGCGAVYFGRKKLRK